MGEFFKAIFGENEGVFIAIEDFEKLLVFFRLKPLFEVNAGLLTFLTLIPSFL